MQSLYQRCKEVEDGHGRGGEGWSVIKSPSPDVKMSMKYFPPQKGERSVATGRAEGVVDCEAAEVAAWLYDFNSREATRISREQGQDIARLVLDDSKPGETTVAMVKRFPFPLLNREFVLRDVFKVEANCDVMVAIESVDINVEYGASFKSVRGFTRALWRIVNISDRDRVKQCRVTVYQFIDAGGSIPTWLVNRVVPETLGFVQEAIDVFRQDDKVDNVERDKLMTLMKESHEDHEYTEDEVAILDHARNKFEGLKESDFEHLESPDVFVKMHKIMEENGHILIGRASTVIDTTIEECAAWEWAKMSRERSKKLRNRRKVVQINDHSDIQQFILDLKLPGFQLREFLTRSLRWREDANTIILVYVDATHRDFPLQPKKYTRASTINLLR